MFEAVLFDFDGTLVDYTGADLNSLKSLHSFAGAAVSFEDFFETTVDALMDFHNLAAEHKIDPLLMHDFRLRKTFAIHKLAWRDEYVNYYRSNLLDLCVPFEGVIQLLEKLKKQVKTGLVSNAYDGPEQRERIYRAAIRDYFDVIVIAGEIGLYKPDPSIFLYALDRLKISPDKAIYIGDSVTYDILGAGSAGMSTVLFSHAAHKENQLADYNVQAIDSLDLLMDRLLY